MPSPKDTGGPIVKTDKTAGKVRSRNRLQQCKGRILIMHESIY